MASTDPRRRFSLTAPFDFPVPLLGFLLILSAFSPLTPLAAGDFVLSSRKTTIEYSPVLGHGSGDVVLQLRESQSAGSPLSFVGGVTFSISNDPDLVKPISLAPSGILLLLNGGTGPELVDVQLSADGAIARWTFSLSGGSDVLFPGDLEIATLTLSTIPGAWVGNLNGDDLTLSDEAPPSQTTSIDDLVWVEGNPRLADWEMNSINFVPGPRGFLRGDANQDGVIEGIPDAIKLLAGLFNPAVDLGCLGAADINDDSWVDLGDAIYLLNWKFGPGGPPPPPPFPDCGADPTPDSLDCSDPSC